MNREADLGQVCLLHTQHVRSLPGAVSNPARLHRQHRHLPSQRPPANTTLKDQAEERFDSLGRENKPEAPSSFLGGFPGGTQGQLCLGSTPSPADSCTRGWERGVQCCGMSGVQGVPLP